MFEQLLQSSLLMPLVSRPLIVNSSIVSSTKVFLSLSLSLSLPVSYRVHFCNFYFVFGVSSGDRLCIMGLDKFRKPTVTFYSTSDTSGNTLSLSHVLSHSAEKTLWKPVLVQETPTTGLFCYFW